MKENPKVHNTGQNLSTNHIDRKQIYNSALIKYIEDGAILGLLLSPQAFSQTIKISSIYDDGILEKLNKGLYGESLAMDLILENVHRAADLLGHVFDQTDDAGGWVVLPISNLLTNKQDDLLQDDAAAQQIKTWIMLLDVVAWKSASIIKTKPATTGTREHQ